MRISIICVGKIKEKYLKLGIDEFKKRLSKYCKLEIIELDDEKAPENLSDKVLKRGNYSLCFSKMTFPHQLFRVMLLEQVYRGFRISNGEPYHK